MKLTLYINCCFLESSSNINSSTYTDWNDNGNYYVSSWTCEK